jgi:membrane protease YdiL (CAAX protease family)
MFAMARQGARRPHLILATVMLLVLAAAGFVTALVPEHLLFGDVEQASSMPHVFFQWTVPFVLMTVALWVWIGLYEKRSIRTLGLIGGKALKKYFVGVIVGLAMVSGAVGLMAAAGSVQFEEGGSLPSGVPAIGPVALLLLAFVIQAAAEEVLVRGWYLPVIGARHGPWVGVVASSLVFAAFHGFTNALATINLGLFGVFLALYCLYEGSIWGVCGWHAVWNWAQANVFGLHVTGYPPDGGVVIDLQATGSQLLSGGSYGPEGSIMGSVSLLTGIVILILLANRKARKPAAG